MFFDPPDYDEIHAEGEEHRREALAEVQAECSHSWVAGCMVVHPEDLAVTVRERAAFGETVDCQHCELVATAEMVADL